MTTLQTFTILISFGLLSCNNRTETTTKNKDMAFNSSTSDSVLKTQQHSTSVFLDSIKTFEVDDYPVTNKMFQDKRSNNSNFNLKSGQTISFDKVWFSNDTLNQTLVFELYTDYHRILTYHFYNNEIQYSLINRMELINGEELASEKQKLKDFNGFLKQSTKINSSYFVTNKGFKLGDTKQKAIDIYGIPDNQITENGVEKLEWLFVGDSFYDSKTDLKGKPLADNSFGHQITMYFRNEKLIGQILFNQIP